MKLTSMKTDPAKVEAGMWIGDIPDMGDLKLKVRPIGNPDYQRLYGRLVDATPRQHKPGGVVDFETRQQISARTLAETVLLGWEGLEDDDGKPLPYTADKAKELLSDPNLSAFRDAVAWAGSVARDQSIGNAEDSAKN